MKQRTNKKYCPVCGEEWEFCECEQLYPEPELIKLDEQIIESSIDFEV